VPGSAQRPHFTGPAYVRIGSQTIEASPQQFERLIAERNSKCYRILQYQGELVRVERLQSGRAAQISGRVAGYSYLEVVGCTQFAVTLRQADGSSQAIAFDRIEVIEDVSTGDLTLGVRED
jgi:hypothetical protein